MTKARHFALPLMIAVATVALSACKGADKPEAAASSAPEGKPGVTITGAKLVLPAVAGNPGAAYFVVDNQGKDAVTVASVAVTGASKTEIHAADMKVLDGGKAEAMTHLDFAPGGPHVMVFGIGPDLKAGSETELTVTFTDGDKVSVPAKIEAMGAASEAPRP